MLTTSWIWFKVHRFEIIVAVLACAIITATAVIAKLHLDGAVALVPPGCFDAWFGSSDPAPTRCEGPVLAFFAVNEAEAGPVMGAMAILPFVVGLLLGVPLVSGELETRTAETAWTLAGSRRRWLAYLAIPALLVVLLTVGAAAATATILAASRDPVGGPGWHDIALYGPIVVARGATAFGVGLLAGAIVGRTLPALIVAVLACGLVVIVAVGARQEWVQANQQVLELRNGYVAGALFGSGQRYIDASGAVLTPEEAIARVPPGTPEEEMGAWLSANMREVDYGVPASSIPAWERLEVIGLGAATVVMLIGSFVVVERRRPR